jgi:hypothetical protein
MPAANSLIGDTVFVPEGGFEDATTPIFAGGIQFGAPSGANVPRLVAGLLVLAATVIILFRYAGLQAMVAVGQR